VLAQDASDFRVRLAMCVDNPRLPKIVHEVLCSTDTRIHVDSTSWLSALGRDQQDLEVEFRRHLRRCLHLGTCLTSIFAAIGSPLPDKPAAPLMSPGSSVARVPAPLRRATVALLSLFLCGFAVGEILWGRHPKSRIREELATSLVKSIDRVESMLFGLVAGMSAGLNAKDDPDLISILSDQDLFRRTFDAQFDDDNTQYTLEDLQAELQRDP